MFKNAGLWEREEYVFGHKKWKCLFYFILWEGSIEYVYWRWMVLMIEQLCEGIILNATELYT